MSSSISSPGCVNGSWPSASCCSGAVRISTDVQSVAASAFAGCAGLLEVTLPSGVTSVGDGAFRSCSALSSVSLSTGLLSLGASVFSGCTALSLLVLPVSLTSIGADTFGSSSVAPFNRANHTLYVPVAMAASVYSAVQASCSVSSYSVNNSLTTGCINQNTPVSACGSGAIEISTDISSLANRAFYSSSVTSVRIPANILWIGDS